MKRSASPPATLRTPKPTSPTSKRVITGANTPAGASRKPSSTSATPLNSTPTTPWLTKVSLIVTYGSLRTIYRLKRVCQNRQRTRARGGGVLTSNIKAPKQFNRLTTRMHELKYASNGIGKLLNVNFTAHMNSGQITQLPTNGTRLIDWLKTFSNDPLAR